MGWVESKALAEHLWLRASVNAQGPYVLLLVSLAGGSKSSKVQTGLLISAYRGLSRPFRKNVKYIILVRPSKPVKGLLSFLRPFVSRKAHRKILKVSSHTGPGKWHSYFALMSAKNLLCGASCVLAKCPQVECATQW